MKYRSYEAYTGSFTQSVLIKGVEVILNGINERKEKIISVTKIDAELILIITLGQDDDESERSS